ncbi:hypothetical protein EV127DRAFT_417738 [Xylaria flabelliformis]|nr:hypothetical protein EV127DRAFT_417738 [Xylaria flabelliformis]
MSADHLSYPPRLGGDISNNNNNNNNNNSQDVLVFLVPGNPGLIGYYAPFLSALRDLLDATTSFKAIDFHIHGQSLAGFVDGDHEPFTSRRKPYDLEYQIQRIVKTVSSLRIESGPKQGQPYDHVLLIGHSVGAYIVLETCHRVLRDPCLAPELKLTSGILLFPTIDHIADSPSGWKLNMLRQTPLLGDNAYRIAQGFLRLWPYDTLYWFVSKTLGFPQHAAEVTTRWLKSRDGVWQSLHLGMDEMRVIGEDKWDDELWEIATSSRKTSNPVPPPKFYFFFGQQDHWVADHYRDEFIRKRSSQNERTRLIVDESKLPHAFCIEHSQPVAERVHAWITEMFGTASSPTTKAG